MLSRGANFEDFRNLVQTDPLAKILRVEIKRDLNRTLAPPLSEKAGLSKFQGEKVGLKLQKVGLNIHSNGFNYSAGKCDPGFLEMHSQKKSPAAPKVGPKLPRSLF